MVQNTDLEPSVCPQCSGRTVQNVVSRNAAGERVLIPVQCGLCDGRGYLPVGNRIDLPAPPAAATKPAPPPLEMWPYLVFLGLFLLFFLYLWL